MRCTFFKCILGTRPLPPQIDLADIADAYEDVRGESLERAIKADCSGDYMRMLISLVRRK